MKTIHITMRWLCLSLLGSLTLHADEPKAAERPHPSRWEEDIQKFEKADQETPPREGGIVFIGSSSIRMWDLGNSFPDANIVNRGFGGSWIQDSSAFAARILLPHRPQVIALYAGDNDVAGGLTSEAVFDDYVIFADWVHENLPEAELIYISIKPSISRKALWPTMRDANEQIEKRCENRDNEHFADIARPMLGDEGELDPKLFLDDNLHLSESGYAIWTDVMQPLLQELATSDSEQRPEE